MKHTLLKRLACLAVGLCLAAGAALPAAAAYEMPVTLTSADESVYLVNRDTGKVILSQNADTTRYIASLTKMITGLLLIESGEDLNTEITIPTRLTQEFKDIQTYNGADAKLKIGETVRLIDLLYALLVPSANDAASVIADHLSDGDTNAFLEKMNARAAALGCTGTTFTCVHGLYDAGNVSTAEDVAKIAAACADNEQFMAVACTQTYTMPVTNIHPEERELSSSNLMMNPEQPFYRDYIRGVKTGFTTLAGRCFATTAVQGGHSYLLVVLGSGKENIYAECAGILDWVFASFSERLLLDIDTPVATVPLRAAADADSLAVYAAQNVTGYGHAEDSVTVSPELPKSVKAGVRAGDVIGKATVLLDGEAVATVDLVAHETIESALAVQLKNTLLLLPALAAALLLLTLATLFFCAKGARIPRGRRARK